MICTTIREILTRTEEKYGPEDAVRYKTGKNEIVSRTYTQLKEDSEAFSRTLKAWDKREPCGCDRKDIL